MLGGPQGNGSGGGGANATSGTSGEAAGGSFKGVMVVKEAAVAAKAAGVGGKCTLYMTKIQMIEWMWRSYNSSITSIVAGTGGGGSLNAGAGGAEGYRASGYGPAPTQGESLALKPGLSYCITVGSGGGGNGGFPVNPDGVVGTDSTLFKN